jgi:SAM-dependent methyltransferase
VYRQFPHPDNLHAVENWDDLYRETTDYFGPDPDPSLTRFVDILDPSRTVLDIGCGQGRNTLYLAHRGFNVDALDPSRVALEQLTRAADECGVSVRTIHGTFQDLGNDSRNYGGILVFGLIPVLYRSEVSGLVSAVTTHLGEGGVLIVTAFGTWDPDCGPLGAGGSPIDGNSDHSPRDRGRTYLEPGELAALFPGFEIVHSWEGLTPVHRHGDGPPERHGRAEAVFRR